MNEVTLVRVFDKAEYRITRGPDEVMPMCLGLGIESPDGFGGSIIVSQAPHDDGLEWIHASIAFEHRDPTYRELTLLHAGVFGRKRWSYQCFVPDDRHVNIHEHALHLWGRADGQPSLPDFGINGTI